MEEKFAVGQAIPKIGVDTTLWRSWEESKLSFEECATRVDKMVKRTNGRPVPCDLSEARILIIWQGRKNGRGPNHAESKS